jgi:hypothetical protein
MWHFFFPYLKFDANWGHGDARCHASSWHMSMFESDSCANSKLGVADKVYRLRARAQVLTSSWSSRADTPSR